MLISPRAIGLLHYSNRQIAARDLADILFGGEPFDLPVIQTDANITVKNSDRRRNRSVFANDLLEPESGFYILGVRKAMCDNGRFERDNRKFFVSSVRQSRSTAWSFHTGSRPMLS